jgi:DNA-binding transcriptional ArsR family regulator
MSRPSQDLIFRALADHRRREILDLVKEAPKTTGALCDHFKKIDRCTVMQHLGVLEQAGLVIVKREGRRRWNYLNVAPIQEIYNRWISQYASRSAKLLARMKREMELSPLRATPRRH